jgi:hypothetical protein
MLEFRETVGAAGLRRVVDLYNWILLSDALNGAG